MIKKHISPKITNRPKFTVLSKVGTSHDKLRRSLIDETPEIPVKEQIKNYQSNGALDAYERKTASIARSSHAHGNQSSVDSTKDQYLDTHFDWNRQTMLNRFKMKVLQGNLRVFEFVKNSGFEAIFRVFRSFGNLREL